ncbi:AAA family ATPase [Mitsuaria sp. WAJ17]|uniref:ATP-binding protein n=1 Tax=Mitsuaria sp. WAJ17 TaxID=2761452 RepID=UPI0016037496|nr:AAA family ATPase [Mitsuaria sp. WAJ17]MBB2485802.1 AAA family ATPase [Mitsuaria sp. WAJ17]
MSTELSPREPSSARRLHLAVLFSDLSDSSPLAAHLEAEDYLELLARVRDCCRSAVEKHLGLVVRMQGDGLLAVFGYPQGGEDTARRATEAALELHAAVARLQAAEGQRLTPLQMHSGIHAGLTLVIEGDFERGRLDLLGEPPNIAARLCEQAEAGEVWVSQAALGPELHQFEHRPVQRLPLRGLAEPLPAVCITRRGQVLTRLAARERQGALPFIGREDELQDLRHLLAQAAAGRARTALVHGSPGLGKTRLCEALIAEARQQGWRIHRGYCDGHLHGELMQPWMQLLRACFGQPELSPQDQLPTAPDLAALLQALPPELQVDAAEWLEALRPQARPPGTEQSWRDWLPRLPALLRALGRQQPQLVFLDDWQWADQASQQILEHLLRQDEMPLMILLTNREAELGPVQNRGDFHALALGPLSLQDCRGAIAQLLPGLDPFLVERIHVQGGGNPLYIEELCHCAAQLPRGQLAQRLEEPRPTHGSWTAQELPWLRGLVEARLERLPAEHLALLKTAAVIGPHLPLWLLRRLCAGDTADTEAALANLARHDLLYPTQTPGQLRFKHGITREIVYQLVGAPQRRELHRRIAERLADAQAEAQAAEPAGESAGWQSALAYHHAHAGDWPEAALHAEQAGERAEQSAAPDRARHFYRLALDALAQCPPSAESYAAQVRLLQRLGLTCVFDPSPEDLPYFDRGSVLARRRNDPATMTLTVFWRGYVAYALGMTQAAVVHLREALQGLEQLSAAPAQEGRANAWLPMLVQAQATLGQALAAAGEYEAALNLMDSAIAIKRQHRSGARPAVGSAYALACKAAVLGDWGTFDEAAECFAEARQAIYGAGHEVEGSVLCLLALVQLWQGRWAEAQQSASQALQIAQRVRNLYVFGMSRALLSRAQWRQGAPGSASAQRALQALEDAQQWLQSRRKRLFGSLLHGWLAEAYMVQDRPAEMRHQAAQALRRAREGDLLGGPTALRALALAAARGYLLNPPERYLAQAQALARRRGSLHETALNRLCQAEVLALQGDRPAALEQLEAAEPPLRRLGMDWHLTQLQQLRTRCQGQAEGAG